MNKISASILVFLALFAFVGAEQFQTLNFDQGRLRFRSLDTTSSIKSFSTVNYTNVTAVNVNLGTAYNTKAAIDTTKTQTAMFLLLAGSTTGFCTTCYRTVHFQCTSNDCAADTTKDLQTIHPFYYVEKGNPFTLNVTIGSDASAWQLKSSALLYTYSYEHYNSFSYPGSGSYTYIQNDTTYGFIGMGVDGDSYLNFVGDHPLFSITVNGSGSGELIFGKNTSKIDTSRTSLAFTTTTNWTMPAKNISLGAGTRWKALPSLTTLIFDINFPGLGIPSYVYSDFINNMTYQYNGVGDTSKVEYNTSTYGNIQYPYIYKGALSNLSSIVIGLNNGQNFTIPPEAYTLKIAEGIYSLLIHSVSYTYNYDTRTSDYYAVIGWSVMSNFYTVFEKTATGNPTVTLNPTYAAATSSTTTTTTSSWKTILIIVVVVLVALVVISMAAKKKNALTKSDLGVELRAARV